MSCGEKTLHGSWYYAASRQRYGCGAHIQIEANGKCVVAETDDYGPDVCVENAAGRPIIDASPLVSEHLFGTQSAGWSDRFRIQVTLVAKSTPLGPCDGGVRRLRRRRRRRRPTAAADRRRAVPLGDARQERRRRHLRAVGVRRRLVQLRRRRVGRRRLGCTSATPGATRRRSARRPAAHLRAVALRQRLVPVRRRRLGHAGGRRSRSDGQLLGRVLAVIISNFREI